MFVFPFNFHYFPRFEFHTKWRGFFWWGIKSSTHLSRFFSHNFDSPRFMKTFQHILYSRVPCLSMLHLRHRYPSVWILNRKRILDFDFNYDFHYDFDFNFAVEFSAASFLLHHLRPEPVMSRNEAKMMRNKKKQVWQTWRQGRRSLANQNKRISYLMLF